MEKASLRALQESRRELKPLLKEESALSLTVGSKFKGKVGKGIQAVANKCICSSEECVTVGMCSNFSFVSRFPASAFLFVSLEPGSDSDLRAAAGSE